MPEENPAAVRRNIQAFEFFVWLRFLLHTSVQSPNRTCPHGCLIDPQGWGSASKGHEAVLKVVKGREEPKTLLSNVKVFEGGVTAI